MGVPTFVMGKAICDIPYKINKTCPKEAHINYVCTYMHIYGVRSKNSVAKVTIGAVSL